MKMTERFSIHVKQHFSSVMAGCIAGGMAAAILALVPVTAAAQDPAAQTQTTEMTVPTGYTVHQSVDLGGRIAGIKGGSPMYDTLVNLQSGPRVLNQTFEMRPVAGNEHGPFDVLSTVSSGFGGDPNNFAKLDMSKGKIYDFSGMFRRDRQYSDYDLLGNPNIPSGQSIAIGPSSAPTGELPYAQVNQSAFLYNTVRRMTDVNLTIAPLAVLTYRFSYSQRVFQGPSLTPSGYQFAGSYSSIIEENQRDSGDDFLGGIDWKPGKNTRLTYEEEIDHEKANSYFTLDPSAFNVTEADGSKAALLMNYYNQTPSVACNSNSMNGNPTLTGATMAGGMPVVNAACAVATSYFRSQPTRILFPTEIFRLQSSSIKNVAINGDVRYTNANMNMPAYYENFQGLTVGSKTAGATTQLAYTAAGSAKRQSIAADFGAVWQLSSRVSLAEQVTFSNVHQPGANTMTGLTTVLTGLTAGSETINSPTTATTSATGAGTFEGSGDIGMPLPQYFGQKFIENNVTLSWDATSRATFGITYRHGVHDITQTAYAYATSTAPASWTPTIVDINEDGAVLDAALRPTNNWQISGSVEAMYNDNALTPVGFRQFRQYRVHTLYRPKEWATFSGTFNDRERHNNTNNTGATPADGPLDHVDHSRFISVATDLFPNEHFGLDLNYAYSDVYAATNICYDAGATAALPGAAPANGALCPDGSIRGVTYYMFLAKDFIDAPTQSAMVAFNLSPNKNFQSNIGYNLNAVSGSQFFNDARAVNGSLNSVYQTPFVNIAWKYRAGWTWKAEYDFFGYGEGGGGPQYCSTTNPSPTVAVAPVACSSLGGLQTGATLTTAGETLPRNFHANNVVLGVHYEF
jgi:hypothetical protein